MTMSEVVCEKNTLRITGRNIVEMLKKRLASGFYHDEFLPSERDLALEFGAARLTVRRALERMVEQQLLKRAENGRLVAADMAPPKLFKVVFLIPVLFSHDIEAHFKTLIAVAAGIDIQVAPVYYAGWHDPALHDGCDNCDGLILLPRHQMPEWFIRKLLLLEKPVLALEWDLSNYGIPSLNLFPREMVSRMLDYLLACGYDRIDLLNISPWNPVQVERKNVWESFHAQHKTAGALHDYMESGRNDCLEYATLHRRFRTDIESGKFNFDHALVATSLPAAMLFIRAAADLHFVAGRDYSLAVFDGETQAPYLTPAITSLERVRPEVYFRQTLSWMKNRTPWSGTLLCQSANVELHIGESIRVKCPKTR